MSIKIAFHDNTITVRGSSVAVYDYAHYNEQLLGNLSIIISPYTDATDRAALVRFTKRFPVFHYSTPDELEEILQRERCDILYCIKYGKDDGVKSNRIKTVIHCVFDMTQPHGDVYAAVSSTLATKFNKTLFVPHMISLSPVPVPTSTYRDSLPEDAVVFGRYGGMDTMDLLFCWRAIELVLKSHTNIYFLFANTPQQLLHPNIKYVDKLLTEDDKRRFIYSCDAYIECSSMGHTFGLAMGEFSICGKPIIAYRGYALHYDYALPGIKGNIWTGAHIDILGNKGIYYQDEKEFYHILTSFRKRAENGDLNAYRDYTPERVMSKFKQVFIS